MFFQQFLLNEQLGPRKGTKDLRLSGLFSSKVRHDRPSEGCCPISNPAKTPGRSDLPCSSWDGLRLQRNLVDLFNEHAMYYVLKLHQQVLASLTSWSTHELKRDNFNTSQHTSPTMTEGSAASMASAYTYIYIYRNLNIYIYMHVCMRVSGVFYGK